LDDEEVVPTANDEALALALQQEELGADEEVPDAELARALALSRREMERSRSASRGEEVGSDEVMILGVSEEESDGSMEEVSIVPSGRSTPQGLSHKSTPIEIDEDEDDLEEVVAGPSALLSAPSEPIGASPPAALNDLDQLLLDAQREPSPVAVTPDVGTDAMPPPPPLSTSPDTERSFTSVAPTEKRPPKIPLRTDTIEIDESSDEEDFAILTSRGGQPTAIPPGTVSAIPAPRAASSTTRQGGIGVSAVPAPKEPANTLPPPAISRFNPVPPTIPTPPSRPVPLARQSSSFVTSHVTRPSPLSQPAIGPTASSSPAIVLEDTPPPVGFPSDPAEILGSDADEGEMEEAGEGFTGSRAEGADGMEYPQRGSKRSRQENNDSDGSGDDTDHDPNDNDDSRSIEWSESPPPTRPPGKQPKHTHRPALQTTTSASTLVSEPEPDEDEGDMNKQDMVDEEDDYARFMAQIKNRDLNEVRGEIDDEIRVLNSENKVAMRDSDEITQAMVAQIQVSAGIFSAYCRVL
jgi:DNA excision repair protein ERCC-5